MLLVEVNISKIAFFIAAQNFSQVVTKFITCDDVTQFDGNCFNQNKIIAAFHCSSLHNYSFILLIKIN